MDFAIRRRRMTVDLYLDATLAAEITEFGERLARLTTSKKATAKAKANLIDEIERLKTELEASTLSLELEALSYSKWKAVLDSNPAGENGVRDLFAMIAMAIPQMVVGGAYAGEALTSEDLTKDTLHGVMNELTDAQMTELWNAIIALNAKSIDPKAAIDLASTMTRN